MILGRAHLLGDFFNTDLHFTNKYNDQGQSIAEIAAHALEALGPEYPAKIAPGDILVGGGNFGAVSSREQAVKVMRSLGIGAVLARSFARLFFRNAINNGLYAIACDTGPIGDGDLIEIDPSAGRVSLPERAIDIVAAPLPLFVRTLVDSGGLQPYVKTHPDWV